ncbi:GAF domain-containing protein [Sphingomonas glacialis]|uniref:GAF domain-containing protein n=1 Tax=Sphingomonas glacialis TaxID=658225 RepID=A0A502G3K4_9SPHN|nr:GAF domain-containing protein [Sphingomonas glacialis]TPG56120.1 GAF domain-containing protein [Sphingomonas glacialis]
MLSDRRYPVPDNEASRLDALARYAILDTAPEPVFNDVVKLAQSVFAVPSSAVSFVDDDRQWFKARRGIAFAETRREDAFCTHTILSDAPMVVPDAMRDPRFRDTALVVRTPYIRFYAGAPLTTPAGFNIGTLCVIDSAPRDDFRSRERQQLAALATVAMAELDRRAAYGEQRHADRLEVALHGMVSGYGVIPTPVEIPNISARGAMIRGALPQLQRDTALILTIRNTVVVATVVWSREDAAGLAFEGPIDPVLIARMNDRLRHGARSPSPAPAPSIVEAPPLLV